MQRCDLPRHVPKSFHRHEPESTVLYQIVREHMNTFFELADARSGEGRGLPRYVKNAFLSYLECGILAHGFARVRCPNCGYDTVVAYSCKERGLCPSCPPTRRRKPPLRRGLAEARSAKAGAARHMSETAAFLVDRVLPRVPVRQWVLSLPIPVRYILARDAKLLGKALGMFVGEIFRDLRRRAGVRRMREGPCGAVTGVQRFGGALNLNIHFHSLVLDGVYRVDPASGALRFQRLPPPSPEGLDRVLMRARRRICIMLPVRAAAAVLPGAAPAAPGRAGDVPVSEALAGWEHASGPGAGGVSRQAGGVGAASEGASGAVSRHLGTACEAAPGSACPELSRAQPRERAPRCGASRRGASAATGSS